MFTFLLVVIHLIVMAQPIDRPFILVKQKDRSAILQKIKTQDWARDFYHSYETRLNTDIKQYRKSPSTFLRNIPFNWSRQEYGKIPPLVTLSDFNDANRPIEFELIKYLQISIDCGVMYFLTENEEYAQCALDILHSYVEGILQLEPSDERGNGGWLYPNDHLREARVIGAQLPIIYDFIEPFISQSGQAFDIGLGRYIQFNVEHAQKVFLTYAKLATEHGHTGSNWSILESFSLVHNALALEDLSLRQKYLDFYLSKGTDTQDALPDVALNYQIEGDVYPETSQYSNAAAAFTTRMLLLLDRYDSSLRLGEQYYKIPFSLDRWDSVRYPNDEIIRFGDGKRKYKVPYNAYDMAYLLGVQSGTPVLTDKFGPLLTEGINQGTYDRGALGDRTGDITIYFTPTRLLWLDTIAEYPTEDIDLPRTDKFPHAGVYLQRNLSETNDPDYGLMCFVGGCHMVHGHASGMDMELYGLGEVLGVDHGRGPYRTDLHENYSRLFAAHNTVVVNGSSQGDGGWVNLGMNSTQLVSMEPLPTEAAISPYHSFTRTTFVDDRGDKAEAHQERTMALIRTSPTTGYYMDVFRSDSALPDEYHDYIYHNIGDDLRFLDRNVAWVTDADRFMANANAEHIYNKKFRNPGWHFFDEVASTDMDTEDVKAQFLVEKLKDKSRYMNLFILGGNRRTYTKAMAPKTFEAPKPYHELPTPTLVIRQEGEAWNNPFAVIYEPSWTKETTDGVQSVDRIESKGVFKGFKIVSRVNSKLVVQYIITQDDSDLYNNAELGISFEGAFCIITFDGNRRPESVYIGDGRSLTLGDLFVTTRDNNSVSAYIELFGGDYSLKTNGAIDISFSR